MGIGTRTPRARRRTRIGLLLVALPQAFVGAWALLAPRSWHDSFPGWGSPWVAAFGSFDEHLTRDVGALFLALSVLLVLAAVSLDRLLVQAACVAWLIFAVPHLMFHVLHTERFDFFENAVQLAALAFQVVVPLLALAWSGRLKV